MPSAGQHKSAAAGDTESSDQPLHPEQNIQSRGLDIGGEMLCFGVRFGARRGDGPDSGSVEEFR